MKNYVLMYYSIMQLLNLFMVKSIKKKKCWNPELGILNQHSTKHYALV